MCVCVCVCVFACVYYVCVCVQLFQQHSSSVANVTKLSNSISSDESSITALQNDERDKLEVSYIIIWNTCMCVGVSMG